MRKIITFIILCLSLQACTPLVFVAGATVGGAVIYDQRSIKQIFRDQTISQRIRARLSDDRILMQKAHIAVSTFDGIVLLTGQAPTPHLRHRAVRVVRSTKHIRRVYNQISLESPTPPITRTNDSWITAKVKAALLNAKGLHSTQIKVVTENGTVYLMGLTDPKQAHMSTEVTRRVPGVIKVVKLFEYTTH